jgi:hypothetical protein
LVLFRPTTLIVVVVVVVVVRIRAKLFSQKPARPFRASKERSILDFFERLPRCRR